MFEIIVGWIKNNETIIDMRKYQNMCFTFLMHIKAGTLQNNPNPTNIKSGKSAKMKVLINSLETSSEDIKLKSFIMQSKESTDDEALEALVKGEKALFIKSGHFKLKLIVPVTT